jgi:hypothetical protein
MEKEVKDQLLQKLLEYVEASKDFFIDQSPEVVQQIFTYHLYATWLEFLGCLTFVILLLSINLYCVFCPNLDKYGNREFISFFGSYMPFLISIPFILGSYACVDKFLKIYMAPKYFLISLIMNMKG